MVVAMNASNKLVRKPSELDYCDDRTAFTKSWVTLPSILIKNIGHDPESSLVYIDAYYAKRKDLLREIDFINDYIIELGLIREPTGIKPSELLYIPLRGKRSI